MSDEQIEALINVLRYISHGDRTGPTGFEALAMSLAGEGFPGESSVLSGLDSIANAIRDSGEEIGASLRDVAEAIKMR
jgi:hypothetical protein